MSIQEYFGDWSKVVDLKEADNILRRIISSKEMICPSIKDVFKAFKLCSLHNLRVVILAQDPYSTLRDKKPIATGIALANDSNTPEESYSPSLEVLKESVIDFTIPHRRIIFDPSLEKWENQGVLMLNTALTCKVGRVGSHSLIWRPFIKSLLTQLSKYTTGIVYVLMGNDAQSFEGYICSTTNKIIKCKHPSWYARNNKRMPSDMWREINTSLNTYNGYGIEWFYEY